MTTKKFSKGEAIKFGWNMVNKNLGFFIGLMIIVVLIYIVPVAIGELIKEDIPVLYIVINIASTVLQIIVGMGLIKIALSFCDNENEEGKFADLFSCLPIFFNYLLGSILYMLIMFAGMLLLIIPGIIWAIKFQFFSYLIIDKELGPIEALKMSSAITKDTKWDLFLFYLLILVINLLGALALGFGLFVSIPTTMIAIAFVYRKLLAQIEITQMPETRSPFQAPA